MSLLFQLPAADIDSIIVIGDVQNLFRRFGTQSGLRISLIRSRRTTYSAQCA